MIGKKQVTVHTVPVHLKDNTVVTQARIVSNEGKRAVTIVLGPDEGAIIGTFLHHADLTAIGIQPPVESSSAEEKEESAGT